MIGKGKKRGKTFLCGPEIWNEQKTMNGNLLRNEFHDGKKKVALKRRDRSSELNRGKEKKGLLHPNNPNKKSISKKAKHALGAV